MVFACIAWAQKLRLLWRLKMFPAVPKSQNIRQLIQDPALLNIAKDFGLDVCDIENIVDDLAAHVHEFDHAPSPPGSPQAVPLSPLAQPFPGTLPESIPPPPRKLIRRNNVVYFTDDSAVGLAATTTGPREVFAVRAEAYSVSDWIVCKTRRVYFLTEKSNNGSQQPFAAIDVGCCNNMAPQTPLLAVSVDEQGVREDPYCDGVLRAMKLVLKPAWRVW